MTRLLTCPVHGLVEFHVLADGRFCMADDLDRPHGICGRPVDYPMQTEDGTIYRTMAEYSVAWTRAHGPDHAVQAQRIAQRRALRGSQAHRGDDEARDTHHDTPGAPSATETAPAMEEAMTDEKTIICQQCEREHPARKSVNGKVPVRCPECRARVPADTWCYFVSSCKGDLVAARAKARAYVPVKRKSGRKVPKQVTGETRTPPGETPALPLPEPADLPPIRVTAKPGAQERLAALRRGKDGEQVAPVVPSLLARVQRLDDTLSTLEAQIAELRRVVLGETA